MIEWICKRPGAKHPSVAKGYEVKFNYDGTYEVRKDGRVVKGGFLTEEAARRWADEWVRLGDG
jgi:hypothetical protein